MNASEKRLLVKRIRAKYHLYGESFTEKQARIWAAGEAKDIGYGGVTVVHEATGISRMAIHAGLREISDPKKKAIGDDVGE